jgi:ABC-type nitrate/sulfonate/bicarbonate transport system permease component
VPLAVLIAWGTWSAGADNFFFPPLTDILRTFKETWLFSRFGSDAVPSLERMALGFGLAVLVGVGGGLLLGSSPVIGRLADPLVEFLRAIPPPLLIPIAILVLGIGAQMKVAVIAAGCVWPILLNTVDGVRGVEPTMLEMSRSYGVSRARQWAQVLLPAAMPQIFSGLRAALSIALILMVISELVASTNGIGYFVLDAQRTFAIPEMWSGIILLGLLGYTLNGLLLLAERHVLRWHRGWRSSQLAAAAEPL